MYQLTIRQEGGQQAVSMLCGLTGERTANKAIWKAIRSYPDLMRERDGLWTKAQDLHRELRQLREAVLGFDQARQDMTRLAGKGAARRA